MNLALTQFLYKGNLNVVLINKDNSEPICTIKINKFCKLEEINVSEDYVTSNLFKYCHEDPNDEDDEYKIDLSHAEDRGIVKKKKDCYIIDFDKVVIRINLRTKLSLLLSADTKLLIRGVSPNVQENAKEAAQVLVNYINKDTDLKKLSRFGRETKKNEEE